MGGAEPCLVLSAGPWRAGSASPSPGSRDRAGESHPSPGKVLHFRAHGRGFLKHQFSGSTGLREGQPCRTPAAHPQLALTVSPSNTEPMVGRAAGGRQPSEPGTGESASPGGALAEGTCPQGRTCRNTTSFLGSYNLPRWPHVCLLQVTGHSPLAQHSQAGLPEPLITMALTL